MNGSIYITSKTSCSIFCIIVRFLLSESLLLYVTNMKIRVARTWTYSKLANKTEQRQLEKYLYDVTVYINFEQLRMYQCF